MIFNDTVITSRKNEKIAFVCGLNDKKNRDKYGCFVIEGVKLVNEAILRGAKIRMIFVLENYLSTYLSDIVNKCEKHFGDECNMFLVNKSCFEKITTEKAPQGILAVVDKLDTHVFVEKGKTISLSNGDRVMMLASLRDPGNLGTIIRSAAAFGINALILSTDCVDIYNPKTVRSAMGSLFCVKIYTVEDLRESVYSMIESGRRVFAAELRDNAKSVFDTHLETSDCIIIGNEGHGIPVEISSLCSSSIYLPISDKTESLNAAIAASVLLWEQMRFAR